MDQPLTFVCDDQKTGEPSSTTSSNPSVCEIPLHNYLKAPCLDNKVSHCNSLSLGNEPLIFETNSKKIKNSKEELDCDISVKFPECEHSNLTKSSCFVDKTKGSIVNYETSSDSES